MEYVEDPNDEPKLTPEEFLAQRKSQIRKSSLWSTAIGSLLIVAHLLVFIYFINLNPGLVELQWSYLFRSIIFILGVFAFVGGIYGLYESKRITLEDVIPTREAYLFAQEITNIKAYYTYTLVTALVIVFIVQNLTGMERSVEIAALNKERVWEFGEWWRILTAATMHGGILHIVFNGGALRGFGEMIEYLSNRAHLAIVFFLAAVTGGLFSMLNYNGLPSLGASGGIMGLIGYLAIYGHRRRKQLMPGFLREMLVNIGFIAAFGLVAYQIVDNSAHFGGLLVGLLYGYFQVPRDLRTDPRKVTSFVRTLGIICLVAFLGSCLLTILLLVNFKGF
ncbi:MAG: rhomboid family intramembrane serine protease [Pyrinomonadaceae bacterium]